MFKQIRVFLLAFKKLFNHYLVIHNSALPLARNKRKGKM